MCAFPHRQRLVEHHVLSLGPVEFGDATHREQVLPQVLSSSAPIIMHSDFVDSRELYSWQLAHSFLDLLFMLLVFKLYLACSLAGP